MEVEKNTITKTPKDDLVVILKGVGLDKYRVVKRPDADYQTLWKEVEKYADANRLIFDVVTEDAFKTFYRPDGRFKNELELSLTLNKTKYNE